MDSLQKSTEVNNLVILSYAATAKIQELPNAIEVAIYDVMRTIEPPVFGEEMLYAINHNNKKFYEIKYKADSRGSIIVANIFPIENIDVYLDHINAGTYTVCNS